MRIFKKLRKLCRKSLSVKYFALLAAFSLIVPLTASAANVEVWEFDNFFSVAGGGSPDEAVTEITIEAGDTVTFINQGATDHDAANADADYNGSTFFAADLFSSVPQAPGDTFTTEPFPVAGEVPFFCQIHGADDMAGRLIIKGDDGDGDGDGDGDDPNGGKSFTFHCENTLSEGPAGLETLSMIIGQSESCTIQMTDAAPGTVVEVATLLRAGFRSSISVSPASAMTDGEGKLDVTITAIRDGIDWVAWAVPNEKGEMEFSKRTYDGGSAWGMFVDVSR